MNIPEPVNCDWVLDRIDPFVDGDLPDTEALTLSRHADTCSICAEEITLAQSLQEVLNELPTPVIPVDLTARVFTQIELEERERSRAKWRTILDRFKMPAWRPAIGVLAIILVVLAGSRFWPWGQENNMELPAEAALTQQDLALAEEQAKWALAYISDIGLRTGKTVRDDVIGRRIVGTLTRSVEGGTR
jgi:anti-sigma factor (TIGR02949 family)